MSISPGSKPRAFTILEMLVSTAVLIMIVGISYSILGSIMDAWRAQKARLGTFEAARIGFEILTNRLSQATLNTYWDYDDPKNPKKYIRQSELQFVVGQADQLLPDSYKDITATQAVFFVAPFGFTLNPEHQPLFKMLTACGFYIAFSRDKDRPTFLPTDRIPERYRYRLYQLYEPGELLSIYKSSNPTPWYQASIDDFSFPLADNVIGLIIRAKYPNGNGTSITYDYDSDIDEPSNNDEKLKRNQLPPTLAVTMVVIDEDSARRLIKGNQTTPPAELQPPAGFFQGPADDETFKDQLAEWEGELQGHGINYRIFSADVAIRGAKWSSDKLDD